ncbi:Serine/threonine-protein kinase, active site [Sesbania bispinosa]|nr:Serine/threonine-protein kinase, active site [Sesbania bispinosa]
MAAGRKSTLRSRESYKYNSIKEFDHCKNVSAGVEVDGFLGGEEEREEGEIFVEHGEYAHDPGFQAVDGKETLPPPEKRRKIDVQGWNITMSRWACDGLSPTGTDDKYKQVTGTSSPEADESQRECPESTITRSSGSGSSGNCSLRLSTEDTDFDFIDDVEETKDKKTGEIVALKKVKMNIERDGFPMSSLREINILLSFNHPFIVDVKEVVVDNYDGTFMVMEYMEHDLKGLMELKKQPFSMGEVKYMMLQLLEGVKYLHDNWILHRDLKTSNILLNNKGELKICDFGLSRQYGSPLKPYTPIVVTLWYRAPELLLGAKKYSTAIDMWSVGCIMAELVAKEPLFRGKTEIEQLHKIFQTLGTPDEKIWPGLSKLPGSKTNFVKQPYNMLSKKFPAASFTGSPVLSELGFDLMKKLLTYDPEKRITAEDALLHGWFREAPLPKSDFKPVFSWQ